MERDALTKVFDSSLLKELLEMEVARAMRYRRALGIIALEPVVAPPCFDVNRPGLKRLAKHCLEHTRAFDYRIRWKNSIVIILPEGTADGLAVVCRKIQGAFDAEPMKHPVTGRPTEGGLNISSLYTTQMAKLFETLVPNESRANAILAYFERELKRAHQARWPDFHR